VAVIVFLSAEMGLHISQAALLGNARMVLTGQYAPSASIAVVKNGTALLVKGSLQGATAAAAAARAIGTTPSVASVVLESQGEG
jgi:hypothetical protein